MKYISPFPFLLFFVLIFNSVLFPWGDSGHSLITKKALEFLPEEMSLFRKWSDSIAAHASDPDYRKSSDSTEFPKHFIDIDFYREFRKNVMPFSYEELVKLYTDSIVKANGILPWATLVTYNKLVEAFKSRNKKETLLYLSDLCHYVGDGHQPMHAVTNYDGQLSGQKGIHGRYEIHMIDSNLVEIATAIRPAGISSVRNIQAYIFGYIQNANAVAPVLYDADNFAFTETGSRENSLYYKLLWFRAGYLTEIQFSKAAEDLASLIYTAWQQAGKPSYKDFK